jgi:hypothetical protein
LTVSRALLATVDLLAAEFPELPLSVVYVAVGQARGAAAKRLPNMLAYRDVLEHEARSLLRFEDPAGWRELTPGTSDAGWRELTPGTSDGG